MPPVHVALVVLLSGLTAALGTLGGIGGAVLLVPALVLGGLEPAEAAPLGLLSVGAGSLAAGPHQIHRGLVHHRLGVSLELLATAGAAAGAAVVGIASERVLRTALGGIAVLAAGLSLRPGGARTRPAPPGFAAETSGEWPGTLGGTIQEGGAVVAYQARRVGPALAISGVAGVVAGLSGTSGGFIKTPMMISVMGVPVRVAAATTTFVAGITAAAGLAVHLSGGAFDPRLGAGAMLGALVGGAAGAQLQTTIETRWVSWALAVALAAAGVVLVVRA